MPESDRTGAPLWEKFNPLFPRRTITGQLTSGLSQIWRRQRPDGKWEYQQDPETYEDRESRQW
jgi:hypothetical protein